VSNVQELADRYVAVWNEPDPDRRRESIAELWSEGGAQTLQPPADMSDAAGRLGFTAVLEARGHEALETRVARAYEEFVAPGEFRFRARGAATRVGDVVRLGWEMVGAGDGEVAGSGVEFIVLDRDGRIRLDYQFVD
jgi:hypothetical protein